MANRRQTVGAFGAIVWVVPIGDDGGREARQLEAAISGHTLLHGAGGRLRFSGGITAARGEAGDNFGSAAVFGCVLFAATETCKEGGDACGN